MTNYKLVKLQTLTICTYFRAEAELQDPFCEVSSSDDNNEEAEGLPQHPRPDLELPAVTWEPARPERLRYGPLYRSAKYRRNVQVKLRRIYARAAACNQKFHRVAATAKFKKYRAEFHELYDEGGRTNLVDLIGKQSKH